MMFDTTLISHGIIDLWRRTWTSARWSLCMFACLWPYMLVAVGMSLFCLCISLWVCLCVCVHVRVYVCVYVGLLCLYFEAALTIVTHFMLASQRQACHLQSVLNSAARLYSFPCSALASDYVSQTVYTYAFVTAVSILKEDLINWLSPPLGFKCSTRSSAKISLWYNAKATFCSFLPLQRCG